MPFDRGIFGGGLYELNRHHSRGYCIRYRPMTVDCEISQSTSATSRHALEQNRSTTCRMLRPRRIGDVTQCTVRPNFKESVFTRAHNLRRVTRSRVTYRPISDHERVFVRVRDDDRFTRHDFPSNPSVLHPRRVWYHEDKATNRDRHDIAVVNVWDYFAFWDNTDGCFGDGRVCARKHSCRNLFRCQLIDVRIETYVIRIAQLGVFLNGQKPPIYIDSVGC